MMIKILGSFKVVPDLDQLAQEDWTADQNLLVDTSFAKNIISCYDESGLELMLRFAHEAECQELSVQLDAVTVGGRVCENYLRTLYALGFSEAVRIECEEIHRFEPEWTARLLAKYVNRTDSPDMIMMGSRSGDEENGMTPFLLAEELGWTCVTGVTGFEPVDESEIQVCCEEEDARVVSRVKLPCILSVGDIPCSYLRVPTLKDRMKKGKKEITRLTPQELGLDEHERESCEKRTLVKLETRDQTRPGLRLQGTMKEQARQLYEEYLKDRFLL